MTPIERNQLIVEEHERCKTLMLSIIDSCYPTGYYDTRIESYHVALKRAVEERMSSMPLPEVETEVLRDVLGDAPPPQ